MLNGRIFSNEDRKNKKVKMSGLKVLVPIKRVVDYAVKIRIKADKSGMSMIMYPKFCVASVSSSVSLMLLSL